MDESRAPLLRHVGPGTHRRAGSPLVASLDDADDGLWSTALITLGLIGGDDAIRALVRNLKVLESRTSYLRSFRRVTNPRNVRGPFSPAIFALWYVGSPALPALIEALNNEDEDIRLGAEIALENYVIIDFFKGYHLAWLEVKTLMEAGVTYSFVTSCYFGMAWLVRPAMDTGNRYPDQERSRNHALQRLAAFPGPDAASWYDDWFKNASPDVTGTPPGGGTKYEWMCPLESFGQIQALIDRKGEALIDDIIRYLMDHRPPVYGMSEPYRSNGIIILGMTGSPRAFQPLLQELKYGSFEVQKAAIAAMVMLGDRRAIVPLKRAAMLSYTRDLALVAIRKIEAGDRNPDLL